MTACWRKSNLSTLERGVICLPADTLWVDRSSAPEKTVSQTMHWAGRHFRQSVREYFRTSDLGLKLSRCDDIEVCVTTLANHIDQRGAKAALMVLVVVTTHANQDARVEIEVWRHTRTWGETIVHGMRSSRGFIEIFYSESSPCPDCSSKLVRARASPDAAPRASPDAASCASPDAAARASPDAAARASPDAAPRTSPDATPRASPDAASRTKTDAASRASPDAVPRASPDATPRARTKTIAPKIRQSTV
jgi:hypothetical protein